MDLLGALVFLGFLLGLPWALLGLSHVFGFPTWAPMVSRLSHLDSHGSYLASRGILGFLFGLPWVLLGLPWNLGFPTWTPVGPTWTPVESRVSYLDSRVSYLDSRGIPGFLLGLPWNPGFPTWTPVGPVYRLSRGLSSQALPWVPFAGSPVGPLGALPCVWASYLDSRRFSEGSPFFLGVLLGLPWVFRWAAPRSACLPLGLSRVQLWAFPW